MPSLPHVQIGQALVGPTVTMTQERLDGYSRVSGDDNPLHRDAAFAADVSPTGGVIAHGMLSLAHLSALVSAWAGAPERVLHLATKLRAPAPLGASVSYRGEVVAVDPQAGTATVALSAALEDGSLVVDPRRSRAVVRLGGRAAPQSVSSSASSSGASRPPAAASAPASETARS
jgi:acyl dehydratase